MMLARKSEIAASYRGSDSDAWTESTKTDTQGEHSAIKECREWNI